MTVSAVTAPSSNPSFSQMYANSSVRQKGVVLIVALVMLLIMTGLGVTAMKGATLQERIAGNSREQTVARANAEVGLSIGERELDVLASGENWDSVVIDAFVAGASTASANKHLFSDVNFAGSAVKREISNFNILNEDDWNDGNSLAINGGDARYMIEYIGEYTLPTSDELDSDIDVNTSAQVENSGNSPIGYTFKVTSIGFGNDRSVVSVLQSYYITNAKPGQ